MLKLFTHKIDPSYAATHHDLVVEGWAYAITDSPDYPIEFVDTPLFRDERSAVIALLRLTAHFKIDINDK